MCVEVKFDDGKIFPVWEVETCAELAQRLGGALVRSPVYPATVDLSSSNCLCCVDLEATAAKFGYRFVTDASGLEITFSK